MSYDPTREWNITSVDITLANDNGHFLYVKVPVEADVTTSEVIASEAHIDPLRDEGYIIYKLGWITPVVDGKRTAQMLWGNNKPMQSYIYIAYASADDGSGFTMTFNSSLNYIAIKTTTTAIASPSASDFAGLWKNYKGSDGVGIPTGGTTGQILKKKSATDYDAEWGNNPVSDVAYNSSTWDGVTDQAPSKNAVRDKIESIMTLFSGYAQGGWFEFVSSVITSTTNGFQVGWSSSIRMGFIFEFTLRDASDALVSVGVYHGAYSNNDTPKGILTPIVTFSSGYVSAISLVSSGSYIALSFTFNNLPAGYKLKGSYIKTG